MAPTLFFDYIVTGLELGLIYALMSTGLNLIYGVMRLANFAHGEYYMVGGYAFYFSTSLLGISPIFGVPFAILAGFLIGFAVERLVIRDTYTKVLARPLEYAMLGTMLVSVILQNLAIEIAGPSVYSTPPFFAGDLKVLQVGISFNRVVTMVVSVATLGLLYYFVKTTRTGREWRAVAQNRAGAIVSGINVGRVSLYAYGVGAAMAALSGALLTPVYGVWPNIGFSTVLTLSFVIIVLGGLGSIEGAFIGALIIGLTHSFVGGYIGPEFADVAMYLVLLAVLVLKPTGLFGEPA